MAVYALWFQRSSHGEVDNLCMPTGFRKKQYDCVHGQMDDMWMSMPGSFTTGAIRVCS